MASPSMFEDDWNIQPWFCVKIFIFLAAIYFHFCSKLETNLESKFFVSKVVVFIKFRDRLEMKYSMILSLICTGILFLAWWPKIKKKKNLTIISSNWSLIAQEAHAPLHLLSTHTTLVRPSDSGNGEMSESFKFIYSSYIGTFYSSS